MNLGEEIRELEVEPVQWPQPAEAPQPTPAPVEQPQEVPARE